MQEATIAEIALYAKHFNQRIGQLIDNAMHESKTNADLFTIRDEELVQACRDYFRKFGDTGSFAKWED